MMVTVSMLSMLMILDGRTTAFLASMPLLCQRTETQFGRYRRGGGNLYFLRYGDTRADLGGHGVQCVERGAQVIRYEADEGPGICNTQLIEGLSAAFEHAPFHLGDEASEAGGRWVDEVQFVLDVPL
jgi:hypothetical protein